MMRVLPTIAFSIACFALIQSVANAQGVPTPAEPLPPGVVVESHVAPIAHSQPYPVAPVSARHLKYKHHNGLLAPKVDGAPTNILLHVEDPCAPGCLIEIPVCVCTCCDDVPVKKCWTGLLGRHNVGFEWKSGARVRVVFAKHDDDVIVHTYGR